MITSWSHILIHCFILIFFFIINLSFKFYTKKCVSTHYSWWCSPFNHYSLIHHYTSCILHYSFHFWYISFHFFLPYLQMNVIENILEKLILKCIVGVNEYLHIRFRFGQSTFYQTTISVIQQTLQNTMYTLCISGVVRVDFFWGREGGGTSMNFCCNYYTLCLSSQSLEGSIYTTFGLIPDVPP